MGVRERLAAKTRRRAVVPIDLGPLTESQSTRVAALQADLVAALAAGLSEQATHAQHELERLHTANRVELAFTAIDPDLFEKIAAAYPSDTGADGGMDWKAALPALATLCADDPDLQDEDYWAEQLATWSHGERLSLWRTLFHINTTTPSPYVPKG